MHFLDAFDFNKRTSLYIHVPFCKSKCSYCAFYSKSFNKNEIDSYFEQLVQEIKCVNKRMNGQKYYTAYIGGGNPGCLSIDQLKVLGSLICQNGRPEEFSIEMNPESLTNEHFCLFEQYFTRLSIGVQSLSQKALEFLGRNANIGQTEQGINLAIALKKQTHTEISFDLITCLPDWHDSLCDVRGLVEKYEPDHLSLYSLTLEENTPLYKLNPELPNSDKQSDILSNLWQYLELNGYMQYEVSNFARNNLQSKHNCVYWDYEQYIGLGPAAASTGFVGDKTYRIESPKSVINYYSNEPFSQYQITELTSDEALEEFVLMGLRHFKGLDLFRLKNEFGKEISIIPYGFRVCEGFLVPDKEGILIADWAASEVLMSIDS